MYKDVLTISTATELEQLQGTFAFYCVVSNSCIVEYISLFCGDQIFMDFLVSYP